MMPQPPLPDTDPRSTVAARPPRRPRRRAPESWLALVIIFVLMAGLTVRGDAPFAPRPAAPGRKISAPLVPPRPADVRTLLTNTPLAIAPDDALAINAARPLDRLRLTPARPFVLPVAAGQAPIPGTALDCLTKAVYYEAAVETDAGQRAVAQVVLNRMRSPIFPQSVCGVVFQGSELSTGCQFSFTCDGSLSRQPSSAGWQRARRIALAALAGHVERSVGLATHYHADYVVPYWASSLDKVSTIGAHIFYMMRGSLGRPGAFTAPYDGTKDTEPAQPSADPTAIPPADLLNPIAVPKAGYRTDVQEDQRGTLAKPTITLPAPPPRLQADERKGSVAADDARGVIVHDR